MGKVMRDRKSGSAGMPRPNSYAVFCLKKKIEVGQRLEPGERFVQFGFGLELDTQLKQAGTESITTRMLTQHQAVGVPAYVLGTHDLVGLAMLEHAVLVNTGLMGKGIGTHNCLVRLNRETGNGGYQARRRNNVLGIDPGVDMEQILPGTYRHHDFFERGVTGTLAQAVDGALNLACTAADRCQGVGYEIGRASCRERG